jgi:hypothetical protein
MKNPRKIVVAIIIGFVLSFLVGLISGADFGIVALRALISAVVFGGVTFAVQVIAGKFLFDAVSASDDEGLETGPTVDITIGDEPIGGAFQQEPNAPVFNLQDIEPDGAAQVFGENTTAAFRKDVIPDFETEDGQFHDFQNVPLADASVKRSFPPLRKENLDALTVARAIRTMVASDEK